MPSLPTEGRSWSFRTIIPERYGAETHTRCIPALVLPVFSLCPALSFSPGGRRGTAYCCLERQIFRRAGQVHRHVPLQLLLPLVRGVTAQHRYGFQLSLLDGGGQPHSGNHQREQFLLQIYRDHHLAKGGAVHVYLCPAKVQRLAPAGVGETRVTRDTRGGVRDAEVVAA